MNKKTQKDKKLHVDSPWAKSVQEVCEAFHVDPDTGLDTQTVKQRRNQFGPNQLRQAEKESLLRIFVRQFKSLIALVLFAAAALSLVFGHWIDAVGISAALLINALIGFFAELRAVRSMESLREMDVKHATALREGVQKELDSTQLVPGDVVVIESGNIVTADIRLFEANQLSVDESALTGESVPVQKSVDPIDADVPIAERANMLFKGTAVTDGSGFGIVIATGMETELGNVASMVQEADSEDDPFTHQLNILTSQLVRVILGVAVVTAVVGIVAGKQLLSMVETSIALFVATIPEGLPIVATIALARGMRHMVQRNALVRRLASVQTLGATSIIFSDKTGTLTENRMTVTRYVLSQDEIQLDNEDHIDSDDNPMLDAAVKVGILCSNASVEDEHLVGDPMEIALILAGSKAGYERSKLLDELPESREVAFDPEVKMMATFHETESGWWEAVKGAPDAVVACCTRVMQPDGSTQSLDDGSREQWLKKNTDLAGQGLRVLALAQRTSKKGAGSPADIEPYEDLTLIGLVGLLDPPREDVKEAIAVCRKAGVRVVMVTGDQKETAEAISTRLGIGDEDQTVFHGSELSDLDSLKPQERERILKASVFYRVSPEQKLKLIDLFQSAGSIVAMTGDGVNDAPALKKANIGVAMGERGEQVAEEASDILLQDDRFATIPVAMKYGRIIFDNIRKFVLYMISGNIGEIVIVVAASVAGAPLPLLPLQILYINAVNDIFPALALGVGPGSGSVMERPPRDPDDPIMAKRHWYILVAYGVLIGVSILTGFTLALTVFGMETDQAVTVSFLSVAFARLWHVFNMRENDAPVFVNDVTRNPYVWGALALCVVLLLLAVFIPPVAAALEVVRPDMNAWILILSTSLVPLILGQIAKKIAAVMQARSSD
ncbi:MAG: cation-translocating P-type ATPase [Spirochaeta sp.]